MYSRATRAKYWPTMETTKARPNTRITSTATMAATGLTPMANTRSAAPSSTFTIVCEKLTAHFIEAVGAGRNKAATLRDGLQSLRIVDAVTRSSAMGEPVTLGRSR